MDTEGTSQEAPGQRDARVEGPETEGLLTCLIRQRVGLGQAHLVAEVHGWAPLPQNGKRQADTQLTKLSGGLFSPPPLSGLCL